MLPTYRPFAGEHLLLAKREKLMSRHPRNISEMTESKVIGQTNYHFPAGLLNSLLLRKKATK